ncbi:hypothetical protein [Parvularcula dongshanensis]|uniref:Uncharacterized protein n=1 Tax=Parvularcula dongshanensis TaxID=1173995 RepID=A0A840I076_9PROT|nr:hypothetical protein [Parvularcula dongshanensis]MBB4657654.1 hypothetical protein [Parvularcula dongshanensis]
MRLTPLLALLAFGAPAFAQDLSEAVDQTPEGGMEEAAARYRAEPPAEVAPATVTAAGLEGASEVDLAMAIANVETGLEACRDLRFDMQGLIGAAPGAYAINPGWLRAYQSCLLRRGEESKLVRAAISRRRTEVIGEVGDAGGDTEQAALRAADQLSRLSARQSELALAVQREARLQKDFVRYYNTGEKPASLGGQRSAPAASTPPAGAAPSDEPIEAAPMPEQTLPPAEQPGSVDGALIVPDQMTEPMPAQDAPPTPEPGTPPFDPTPDEPEAPLTEASGAPMRLRGE